MPQDSFHTSDSIMMLPPQQDSPETPSYIATILGAVVSVRTDSEHSTGNATSSPSRRLTWSGSISNLTSECAIAIRDPRDADATVGGIVNAGNPETREQLLAHSGAWAIGQPPPQQVFLQQEPNDVEQQAIDVDAIISPASVAKDEASFQYTPETSYNTSTAATSAISTYGDTTLAPTRSRTNRTNSKRVLTTTEQRTVLDKLLSEDPTVNCPYPDCPFKMTFGPVAEKYPRTLLISRLNNHCFTKHYNVDPEHNREYMAHMFDKWKKTVQRYLKNQRTMMGSRVIECPLSLVEHCDFHYTTGQTESFESICLAYSVHCGRAGHHLEFYARLEDDFFIIRPQSLPLPKSLPLELFGSPPAPPPLETAETASSDSELSLAASRGSTAFTSLDTNPNRDGEIPTTTKPVDGEPLNMPDAASGQPASS